MEKMMIGEIKALNNLIKRMMVSHHLKCKAPSDITGQQMNVIMFLKHSYSEGKEVFQRDVECNLNIRSSTATGILKTLEKNGYIKRVSVPSDARLKKLVLTEKSYAMFEQIDPFIKAINAKITEGLTEEEIEQFFCITEKLKQNIDKLSKN